MYDYKVCYVVPVLGGSSRTQYMASSSETIRKFEGSDVKTKKRSVIELALISMKLE